MEGNLKLTPAFQLLCSLTCLTSLREIYLLRVDSVSLLYSAACIYLMVVPQECKYIAGSLLFSAKQQTAG
jgi:hypothetical protein